MKVGETYLIERIIPDYNNYHYSVVRMTNQMELLKSEIIPFEAELSGNKYLQCFTFKCISPGLAEVQLARYNNIDEKDIVYEDTNTISIEHENDEEKLSFVKRIPYQELDEKDKIVFEFAFMGIFGMKYTPIKVSKQISNVTNYRFFCFGIIDCSNACSFPAIVKITLSPKGKPQIVDIVRV